MEIFNDKEHNEMAHLFLSETRGGADCIHGLNKTDHIQEDAYINLSPVLGLQYTLGDISEKHYKDRAMSTREQGLRYSH